MRPLSIFCREQRDAPFRNAAPGRRNPGGRQDAGELAARIFRVWLLASGAWIMSWVLWLMIYGISRGFRDMHEVFAIPVLLFGPPVALMLFGLVAGWAFRGFMPDEYGKEKK